MKNRIAGRRHGTARQQEIQRKNKPGITSKIEFFWNALPPDLKVFIVSTAAGWASSLASRHGARERSDVHQALKDAFQEGLKNFLVITDLGEEFLYADDQALFSY